MPQPSPDQIHVLVVISPPTVRSKRPIGDEIDGIVKRLRRLESESAAIKLALAAIKPKTLIKLTPLSVHEDEFRLDNLSITLQSDDPIVMTPTLHKFWEESGGFPPDRSGKSEGKIETDLIADMESHQKHQARSKGDGIDA
ncbi:uncharacterized protein PHALS_12630 [Plasmopara halstedii]|uniref:CRN-like protein n=1 Tax=Plasmopara halstedii TaxID=4781 RepID=A0A0P1ANF2_PLAHL|nr:uncharacterized protein PHALS_12630 [Plasmopara halstedii]CEG42351.1 hypothetical protein PHALS_12630 [Plasmopara halstedii]|eukprot:XP_024578720.1 hypothetical protein PHALS_12630 [Plasmopara halstedii]